jgi:hypothetical protein
MSFPSVQPTFPLYRRSANGLNWYRIESPTVCTEVQQVGSRYVVHRLEAVIYPEKARILGLIAMEEGHVHACSADEVEALLHREQ